MWSALTRAVRRRLDDWDGEQGGGLATDDRLVAEALPPEMLVTIALSHKACADGAVIFVRMLKTCKWWRTALLASEDRIWQELAYARFPSLRLILCLAPKERPFCEHYRQQLLGVRAERHDPLSSGLGPELSEYIFSYELWCNGALVGAASGACEDWLTLSMPGPVASQDYWVDYMSEWASMRISVTRKLDLSTILLGDVGVDAGMGSMSEREILEAFNHCELPTTSLPMVESYADSAYQLVFEPELLIVIGDSDWDEPLTQGDLRVRGDFGTWFTAAYDDDYFVPELADEKDVRRYLAHSAPWPTV